MGDVLVVGYGDFKEQLNVPLCLIQDLIMRKDRKDNPNAK